MEKNIYVKPTIYIIKINMPHLMAASGGNILHDAATQKDRPALNLAGMNRQMEGI